MHRNSSATIMLNVRCISISPPPTFFLTVYFELFNAENSHMSNVIFIILPVTVRFSLHTFYLVVNATLHLDNFFFQ